MKVTLTGSTGFIGSQRRFTRGHVATLVNRRSNGFPVTSGNSVAWGRTPNRSARSRNSGRGRSPASWSRSRQSWPAGLPRLSYSARAHDTEARGSPHDSQRRAMIYTDPDRRSTRHALAAVASQATNALYRVEEPVGYAAADRDVSTVRWVTCQGIMSRSSKETAAKRTRPMMTSTAMAANSVAVSSLPLAVMSA